MENKKNLLSKEKTTKQNRVWVRIASACNNKCIFCLDSEAQNGTFPKEEKIFQEIKDWFKIGFENRIIISWWEASINPKFPKYIEFAKNIWYDRIQTVTNGNMFANENFCKKVFEAGLEEVTFSFHWHNSALHDFLVATPWAFKKSLKWLIFIKKYFPKIIINIDIVVNKVNVKYLPEIVKFFMKLWVYEYDILQIIPFWRGFLENKNKLFYDLEENIKYLHETWKLSKIPNMFMWTNRFPVEAFEGYEDLIQDPRKIKSEILWEGKPMFEKFINSDWKIKPECYWPACDYCFQRDFCHNFLKNKNIEKNIFEKEKVIQWEYFPSEIYKKYWENKEDFKKILKKSEKKLLNIPKCLWWTWIYTEFNDLKKTWTLEEYTENFIKNFYRKKSLNCKKCKYFDDCQGIHINFIRSYGFNILEPILK